MSNEPIPTLPFNGTSSSPLAKPEKKKLPLHPLSLIAFLVWSAFTAILVYLLEYAVKHPKLYRSGISTQTFWLGAPGFFITLFAQGHAFVTAWHLGRLGISSVDNQKIGPKTYLEMFWLSHDGWRKPLWLKTYWSAKKQHGTELKGVSVTFAMFAFAFIVALPAPYFLKRAYTLSPIDLEDANYPYPQNISSLFSNASNVVDPYTQLNIGQTAWEGGFSVEDTYPFRVYYPQGTDLLDADISVLNDIMFSADMVPGTYASLPGTRVQSACTIQEIVDDNFDLTLDTTGNIHVPQALWDLCNSQNLTLQSAFHWAPGMAMSFDMGFCHNLPTSTLDMEDQGFVYWNSSTSAPHDETALIWLNLSDYTQTPATQGIIRCNMSISDSVARLWLDFEPDSAIVQFSDVAATQLFKNDLSRSQVPYWPPLLTALNSLSLPETTDTTNGENVDIAQSEPFISRGKMFGFTLTDHWENDGAIQLYRKPNLNEAAAALHSGALHMAAAINIGASTTQQQTLTYRVAVAWWTREPSFALCTYVLLVIWFLTMLGLTICLYRPAAAGGMDSWAIAQKCAEHPGLFDTREQGHADAHENPRILTQLKKNDRYSHSNVEDDAEK